MKHPLTAEQLELLRDAPSRGHDLKLDALHPKVVCKADAPSRGHDLKLQLRLPMPV